MTGVDLMKIVADVRWDGEAQVWYAIGRNKIGLATESGSLDGLRERILSVLPDLLDKPDLTGLDVELVVHGISDAQKPIAAE
jgi:hypothetical protein